MPDKKPPPPAVSAYFAKIGSKGGKTTIARGLADGTWRERARKGGLTRGQQKREERRLREEAEQREAREREKQESGE